MHLGILAFGFLLLASGVPLTVRILISVACGVSFAGLAFLAHEALHGAVTRHRVLRKFLGFVGFLPFCLSPRLWIAWHNRVHHGNTNRIGHDPDAMASLEEYRASRAVALGSDVQRVSRGVVTLLAGFSIQSAHMLCVARRRGYLSARHFKWALFEASLGVLLWVSLGVTLGVDFVLWGYFVPLLFANAIVMAHILTNHGLRPTDLENDPLTSSTTVTVPRFVSFLTLDFGYHTEHHLFPAMSQRHGAQVSRALRAYFPDRYHSVPLGKALWQVCRSPRVYLSSSTLIDPRTGECVSLAVQESPRAQPPGESARTNPTQAGGRDAAGTFDDETPADLQQPGAPELAPSRLPGHSSLPPPSAL